MFDRRQKFCDSAARLDGLAKLNSRSNGLEGQTEPEMKTATHGPDEGRLDLQKSVLISTRGAKSFASPPQPARTMAL